ncbi:TCP-1/cpn60 chaperonin family protein [Natronorubrum aibiense]|uniref:Thermosome n=1 Tax=Natronorubrum aibiense TaxID=348826 RepID=A0A5P9P0Z0_9EURY|nr:TCP-1/cpn60 chaperonin family protein [Natronorubrum aibiense]QFU81811.1 thermosome [Natronorubrum aibiense]
MEDGAETGGEIQFPHANIVAARAVTGVLESSVGPLSHDTLITGRPPGDREPGEPETLTDTISSDGATILEELPIEHPMGPIIRRLVAPERPGTTDVVGELVPDGVGTTVVLLGALLAEGERLLEQGLHPTTIEEGYSLGLERVERTLQSLSRPLEEFDDPTAAAEMVARSAMTGNDIGNARDVWAAGAVEAARQVGMPDEETLAIRQIRSGSIADSRLVSGTVLDRNEICDDRMPRRIEDANVLVLSGFKRGKANDGKTGGLQDPDFQQDGERIVVDSPDEIAEFDEVFVRRREQVVAGLVDAGVDVVVTRTGINDAYQDLLVEHGIVGIRGVNRLKLTQLAQATGATPVVDPTDVTPADLGSAGLVEQQVIDQRQGRRKRRRMVVFDDCSDPESVTFLLHGAHGQLGEQAATEIRKAVAAVATATGQTTGPAGVLPGGGATELAVAQSLRRDALDVDGRKQLVLEAFADATEQFVSTLARNAGMDTLTTLTNLREATTNATNGTSPGLVLPEKRVGDVLKAGLLDPTGIRLRCYRHAVDVAVLILRVDDAIDATFTDEPTEPGDAIYDEHAELHQEYLDEQDETIWHQ